MKVGVGKSSQFANHPVDAPAQQPPGIAVMQDGNARLSAQPLGLGSLFFYIHLIFSRFTRKLALSDPGTPGWRCVLARGSWQSRQCGCQRERPRNQAIWILLACLPLGPVVMSKLTRWPSANVLKPWD